MPTAYGYTRVSTAKQEATPESQAIRCQEYYKSWLEKAGYEWGGVFHDHGVSALSVPWQERPEGQRLIQKLQRDDIIIVPLADRMFRSIRDQSNSVHFLKSIGVKLAILNLNIDTTTAAGKYALGVMTLSAEMESEIKSERMKMFHATRQRKRKPRKTQPPPGWYWCAKRGELLPDHTERELIKQILAWNDYKIQSIKKTEKWLKANEIRRRSGDYYTSNWLYYSAAYAEHGWPCEGFIREFWAKHAAAYKARRAKRLEKLKERTANARRASYALRTCRPETLRTLLSEEVEDIAVLAELPNEMETHDSGQPVCPGDT